MEAQTAQTRTPGTRPITDEDRFTLTPAGEQALNADNLRRELPSLYDAAKAIAARRNSPQRNARRTADSDTLSREVENATSHLQNR